MTIPLPAVGYQITRPKLVGSTSVSRVGNRVISFVETADPVWHIPMRTVALKAAELALIEAFRAQVRSGRVTVVYTPQHIAIPQAYWGNANAAALANDGALETVTNGHLVAIGGVDNGLTLMPGDLFTLSAGGGYRSMHRVTAGGVATANTINVAVEPAVPPYITAGAVAKFKGLELNCRVLPESFEIPDEFFPAASFTLVEVPK